MKKLFLVSIFIFAFCVRILAQNTYTAKIYDAITYVPIFGANIYNVSTEQFVFSDKNGVFSISASASDTLIISKSIYRQHIVILNKEDISKTNQVHFLYCRPVVLKEVAVFGLNPSYEGFKHDVINITLPDVYRTLSTKPTKEDIANADYKNTAPNILRNTKLAHPITALYEAFSPKAKMKRLYNEMVDYEEELENVQSKFNPQLVSEITGLTNPELMEFMVFCHFSYYDLIRQSRDEILRNIKAKFDEYEYFKALQD
ncbi:MAG: hypothetical protein MJZ76_00485 [Bacteroidales bacterium]|nr:hypothetical protein [Bacteroidales bacterium]